MPMSSPLDISSLDHWCGFRPGMTRAEVRERFKQLGIAGKIYSDDNESADYEDWHLDFWFAMEGTENVRQIATDSEILWNGTPIMDLRLDDALRAFEPFGRSPMWEANDASAEPFPTPDSIPTGPVRDEELLAEGTAWLPDLGLGLVMWQGEVIDVVWRDARDLPTQFAGPVTDAQRQLSKRADLADYLQSQSKAVSSSSLPRDPLAPWHALLIFICLGLLAFIAREGFREFQRWTNATRLTGNFVSEREVPRKRFLDLGPEAIRKHMPDDQRRFREMYRVDYLDPTGRPQTVELEAAEFYVPPREAGAEVPLAWLEGDPPRVKGLSRANDAAFLEYFPWAIAVGVFYVIAQGMLRFIPRIMSAAARAVVPMDKNSDPDRPELR